MALTNGAEDEALAKEMEAQGLVRADLADLAALDQKVPNGGGAANGSEANGKMEIEENKGPADSLDVKNMEWQLDMSQVMCINLLAAGAFGKVYYGMFQQGDVAIKLMNLPATMTQKEILGLQSSFKQEIAVWHKLKHPNVVEFVGASLDARNIVAPADALPPRGQPVWAIVTEYMSGGTLKAHLNKKKRLPMRDILRFSLDISRGLEYLHGKDVVHRDMKSDNLLMDHKLNVKIADFGVARTEAKNPVDMTCETGTVRWMAPEVIEHKPYTRKVDVYSFGIVLWELCTCEHPFKDLSFVQLAYSVVNKDLRPTIPDDLNPVLAELLRECWDKDPEKRPDFVQIVARLEALQKEGGGAADADEAKTGCNCTIL